MHKGLLSKDEATSLLDELRLSLGRAAVMIDTLARHRDTSDGYPKSAVLEMEHNMASVSRAWQALRLSDMD